MKEALFIAEKCLQLTPDEDLLVVCDYLYVDMARAFAESLSCEMVVIPPLKCNGEEPPFQVSQLFQAYDAVLALTTLSLGPSDARKKACEKGVRFVSMAGMTKESLETVMQTDYEKLTKRASLLGDILEAAESITVSTGSHTLELSVRGRHPELLTGIFSEKGAFGTLPEGEVLVSPVEEDVEGSFVVDIGMVGLGFFDEPLLFTVEKGQVTSLAGVHAPALESILNAHEGSRQIAECAIGINPHAHFSHSLFEARKVEGSCHISVGDNHTHGGMHWCGIHMDGVIAAPTIVVDGKTVVNKGVLKVGD